MTRDPIRQAIEAGDLCEVGRLYAKQLAEMGKPDNPYGGGREPRADAEPQNGHRLGTAQRVLNQTHLPASTPPRPTPAAATQPSQGGGVGSQTE